MTTKFKQALDREKPAVLDKLAELCARMEMALSDGATWTDADRIKLSRMAADAYEVGLLVGVKVERETLMNEVAS